MSTNVPTRRYQVHDDMGLLRDFFTKADAQAFMRGSPDLHLVTLPRPKQTKQVIDLSLYEEAPY